MVRLFFSARPPLARAPRSRRRLFFSPELLESRQLLSVAAFPSHAMLAPVVNIPALIGPAVASPVSTTSGSLSSAVNPTYQVQLIIDVNPAATGAVGGHGFTETIVFFGDSFATGPISAAPTPTTGAGSPSSGPSTGGNAGATTSPTTTTSITPLAVSIVAGSAGVNRAPIVIVVAPQPLAVTNLAPSMAPVTTQAVQTAVLEEQPLAPPQLGQGFESPVGQGSDVQLDKSLLRPSTRTLIEPALPATDFIEPLAPAPENPIPVEPAQPAQPVVPSTPTPDVQAGETILLEPIGLSDPQTEERLPVLVPRLEINTQQETPAWSMATLFGTAAVATGGYQLLLGGSPRFNQRWLPTRGSSARSRARKARAST